MAVVMSTALVNAIAEAYRARYGQAVDPLPAYLEWSNVAADAAVAVVAALPADYTATDVLAALRGEDVPSEPLPTVEAAP